MKKILVIEDNPIVGNTIRRVLGAEGYEVRLASDGVVGLAAFRGDAPDLVITDIIMPQKEGLQTIREIRIERPDTKIIAISGGGRHGNADYLEVAKKMGARAVLPKPFDPDDLIALVAATIAA